MKRYINYIVIVILTVLVTLLITSINKETNFENIKDSVVYIEATTEDTINIGAGFVYKIENNKNYIITSYHILNGSNDIKVNNTNSKLYAYDKDSDIAILEIEDNLNLKEISIGDSDKLKLGEDIYAIGNPLNSNYKKTLTKGIISYIGREIKINNNTYNTIQFDASISGGNSGGPLLDSNGKVIGLIFTKEENQEGISFALPINEVIDKVEEMLN